MLIGNCWIFGTEVNYAGLRQHLADDGQWHSYSYDFVWHKSDINAQYDTIHIMLEDFYDPLYPDMANNSIGDVFFDNIQLTAIPEPSTLVLFGMGFFGLFAWAWRRQKS